MVYVLKLDLEGAGHVQWPQNGLFLAAMAVSPHKDTASPFRIGESIDLIISNFWMWTF